MRIFRKLKEFLYKKRSQIFQPPRKSNTNFSKNMILYAKTGKSYIHCYFDFDRERWVCPLEQVELKKEDIEYWKHPHYERIFSYCDDGIDDYQL